MGRFDGKLAVVTGAASGIGQEVARQLAAEGARVIALDLAFPCAAASGDEVQGEEAAEGPSGVDARRHDVTSPQDWDRLAAELTLRGPVDVLVNAAGVMDYGPLHATDLAHWRRVLDVNLDGVMLGMRALFPAMNQRRGAAVVNFSSALAVAAMPGSPAYHASKAAVAHLTRSTALSFAARNVRVNAILPGIVRTPLTMVQPDELNRAAVARTPLGRMGTPEEIAKCVLFMASDDAAFMTGSAVVVDGGFSAGFMEQSV
ncbi:2,5-dichloro-2,5-cyclohexadiene-1,4-diol dehydrogenase [Xylaria palmicola]|nr:2,5-dichloro-2,5-cyclohexadiene-1,4-diol dehydrogenase [Xylaria palmicola]